MLIFFLSLAIIRIICQDLGTTVSQLKVSTPLER